MSHNEGLSAQEILNQLRTLEVGKFPQSAVEEAIARKEEMIPLLLQELESAANNVPGLEPTYMLHLYAMYLLAQFREQRALPLLVKFFSWPEDDVDAAVGDIITEDFNRMLASVCGRDFSLIAQFIETEGPSEYARGAAIEALVMMVAHELLPREEVVAYFRSLFQGKLAREHSQVWNSLAAACADLHPGELMDEIQRAYDEKLVHPGFVGLRELEDEATKSVAENLETMRRHHSLITDTAAEMDWWDCFQPPGAKRVRPIRDAAFATANLPATSPKIGRNELCPCGSGKKYKKCCGKEA